VSELREFRAYRVTNLASGSVYIGITRYPVERRWREHVSCAKRGRGRSVLYNAIRSYGAEAFVVEHIASAREWKSIVAAERHLIDQYGSLAPNGYNLIRGVPEGKEDAPRCFVTERRPMSQETKDRISRLLTGQTISEETKAKRRETRALRKALGLTPSRAGIPRSREARRSIARVNDVSYAGVVYDTTPEAAAAAGVTPKTFRHWVGLFGHSVPFLSEHERHALRFAHGRQDPRNRAQRMAA
jgi:hypothetical protein